MNKKLRSIMKLLFAFLVMLFTVSSAFAEPPEIVHLNKINKNALKRFHYIKYKEEKSFRISRGLSKPYPGKPEDAAIAFIKENHQFFKVSEDLSELKIKGAAYGAGPDTLAVRFEQYYQGVPLDYSGITVEVDGKNSIKAAGCSIKTIENLNTSPFIQPEELQGLINQINPEYGPVYNVKLIVYFIDKKPVLSYSAWAKIGYDPYYFIIDASTGKILESMKKVFN